MTSHDFAITLRPTGSETYLLAGSKITMPSTYLTFKRWQGAPIGNTLGGKPLVNYEGKPMFAELAIQRTAVKEGWSARWVQTYGSRRTLPYFFTDWGDLPLSLQVVSPLDNAYCEAILATIAESNGGSYSGCWDVVAWKAKSVLFLESKRHKHDRIRDTQLKWMRAALAVGLTTENFLIVQWEFVS
jgi:hypothetical protein